MLKGGFSISKNFIAISNMKFINMPGFEHGFNRAISEIVGGMVTMIIVINIAQNINPSLVMMFKIVGFLSLIGLIMAMPYWGTFYMLGWIYAIVILYQAGLVNLLELFIYVGFPSFVLFKRITRSFDF